MGGMGTLVVLVIIAVIATALVVVSGRVRRRRLEERRERELAPVRRLAYEDVTALGEELVRFDAELAGQPLGDAARADYQRALDAYEDAKSAADRLDAPGDVRNVTQIIEDCRYAVACVRARVAGEPLPTRRPLCFFDPRHGLSTEDVPFTPPGGAQREVPACALDAERVRAGAEPDSRTVMVGSRRVPYWEGGAAYRPYAAGYFGGFGLLDWMFMGMMFEGLGDGLGGLAEGLGGLGDGLGDGVGDVFGGIGDGLGDMFDGMGDFFG